MPALRTALRLILSDHPGPAAPQSSDQPRRRAVPTKRTGRWMTGGAAVMAVVAVGVLGAPGTAHAHPRAEAAPAAPLTPVISGNVETATTATTVATPPVPATAAPAPASTVPPTYPVVQTVVTLTDSTRSTPARGDTAGSPTRVLRTLVLRPASATGPLPVVVFAAGYDSEPETYLTLLDTWAAAGYLVVAPESPGSARDLPGSPVRTDIAGQAQDLSFTITALIGGAAGPVDTGRITVTGHSDGGSAVAVLALDPAYRDTRISSYIVLSGAIPDGVAGPWGVAPTTGRLLVVVGDEDEYGNLPASTGVFDIADMTKTLVVAHGGNHLGTYLDANQLAAAVRDETLSFLDGPALDGQPIIQVDASSLSITQAA